MVSRICLDIETDGLKPNKIHCLCLEDYETGEKWSFTSPSDIKEGQKLVDTYDEVIGHNLIAYDLPALEKITGWVPKAKVIDTLVMSRLIFADMYNDDAVKNWSADVMPKRYWGSHALKAWGLRLGDHKGDYDGGWETLSHEMLVYCEQDVSLTLNVLRRLEKEGFSQESIDLEHSLAQICYEVGNNGWTFNLEKAGQFYAELSQKRSDLDEKLQTLFEPWVVEEDFYPKVNNKSRGYVKGELFVKKTTINFNPQSRHHIAFCLKNKYNWKPKVFTPSGEAKIDENTLKDLPFPEAKLLAEMFLLNKRISQLAEGRGSWMKLCDLDGKLRHSIITGGTISGRASAKNFAAHTVPAVSAPYGNQCRELFGVPKGWSLVGSDLSGIEVRILASMLHRYDGGEYCDIILNGDIHQYNADALGISRQESKTWLYATLFGAGNALIGKIVGGTAKDGKRLTDNYKKAVPAFDRLKQELVKVFNKRGYILGLDKRKLYIRSQSRLLSQLLQSGGALVSKKWLQLVYHEIRKQNLNSQVKVIGYIHDELQISCENEEVGKIVSDITIRMAQEAGKAFALNIEINAESKLGTTWADTH